MINNQFESRHKILLQNDAEDRHITCSTAVEFETRKDAGMSSKCASYYVAVTMLLPRWICKAIYK